MRELWLTVLKGFPWWRKSPLFGLREISFNMKEILFYTLTLLLHIFVLHSYYTFWGLNILLLVYRGKQTKSRMKFWQTGKIPADFINAKILLLSLSKYMLCEDTPELPHEVVSGVETPHVETLSCSLYSVVLTIFKWDEVWKCCFARRSTESTVRQLSRKIIFGSRKKNKLAKGCSFQVVSGSVMTDFNSVVAQLDPAEKWEGFHAVIQLSDLKFGNIFILDRRWLLPQLLAA